MITPPKSARSFYTALFEKMAAGEVAKIFAPEFSKDVKQVLVTSEDLESDIEAMVECQTATAKIATLVGPEVDTISNFNPIYLPNSKNLDEEIEVDSDGDITQISGFANPYIALHLKYAHPDEPTLIDAKVCFKPFELPSMSELVKNEGKVLLS